MRLIYQREREDSHRPYAPSTRAVLIENRQQLLVVDVLQSTASLILTQKSNMGEQLSEPHIVGKVR
jgi:hypothetical protein